jgi:hypothetical protein
VSLCGKDPDKRNGKASLGYPIDVSLPTGVESSNGSQAAIRAPFVCNGSSAAFNGENPL